MNFNKALKMVLENESVTLFEQVETIKDNGASAIEWQKKGSLLCNIQKKNGSESKSGETVKNTNAGDTKSEELNIRTLYKIENEQRILRDDGIMYEIRAVFRNGRKTMLEHYQATLVRVTR